MPRTREFDIDKAIATATDVFWRYGYDNTSITDLTFALGIRAPSLYAAFGSKEGLFRKSLEHYVSNHLAFIDKAFEAPMARTVAELYLYGNATALTDPKRPQGCLGINCALPLVESDNPIRLLLGESRAGILKRFTTRFKLAKKSGDLAAESDPAVLAQYVVSVGYGMAVSAQSGASRGDLQRIVDLAMKAWPK